MPGVGSPKDYSSLQNNWHLAHRLQRKYAGLIVAQTHFCTIAGHRDGRLDAEAIRHLLCPRRLRKEHQCFKHVALTAAIGADKHVHQTEVYFLIHN